MGLKNHRCLVLNKSWQPLRTVTIQKAITILFSTYKNGEPKAKIVDPNNFSLLTWEEWSKLEISENDSIIKSPHASFKIPEIICLSRYDKPPQSIKTKFSKQALYHRDQEVCQYCWKKFPKIHLTIEHIVPKSKLGKTDWYNCVISCKDCNRKKGDKTLKECGFALLKKPEMPQYDILNNSKIYIESWKSFLNIEEYAHEQI